MSLAQAAQPLSSLRVASAESRLGAALAALNLAGLLVLGLWLRVTELDHVPGINGDEAWYGIQAMRLLHGEPVAWRTPTNNLLNPFFFVPLVLVHLWQAASAAALRWPAVASGVLALPLNYWLCRRAFDRSTALVTTSLLALLPVNIAYSRFGWDASQTLLATLPAVYFPLLALKDESRRQRWLVWSSLAFLASLLVHPTNIFTAPLLAIAACWAWQNELLAPMKSRRHWIAVGGIGALLLGVVAWLARHWLIAIVNRLLAPAQLVDFAWNYERLFSGLTVYRYLAGSNMPQAAADVLLLDLAWWLILALAGCGLWSGLRTGEPGSARLDRCLLCGWAVMLCGFYLVAGPRAIAPHYERYGLCLIAPGAVLLGRGLVPWLSSHATRWIALGSLLASGWLTLLGFHRHYLEVFHETGGQSHDTFRTADIEPKQAALAEVLRQRDPFQDTWIVASEYWNEKPLAYLASAEKRLRVENWLAVWGDAGLLEAARDGRAWFVEFAVSQQHREVRKSLIDNGLAVQETIIRDYAGQPLLSVLRAKAARETCREESCD